ncbi:MAG: acriflavin resistance protein [Parcubacteria group bacterium]|nr:acriflavin resistance protein [Parcubacteria group bacterium]
MIVLLASGLYAVAVIPKEATPDIAIPLGVVSTVLPGASSADVERLVTDKIENGVLGVEHVSKVTSTSADGVSIVSVEFDAAANIDKSIQLLKNAVDKVRTDLPTEALAPSVSDVNFADSPILEVSISGNLAASELTTLGESVSDEIKRVPGVSKVSVSGVRAREVQVIVKGERLRQYGLSLSDVTGAIRAAGVASPAGSITVDGVNYAVRFESGVPKTDAVASVTIPGPGGSSLHVSDVADVIDGLADSTTYSRVSVGGKPAQPSLTLSIFKARGGNIAATGSAVQKKLDELKKNGILEGTEIVTSYNGAEEVAKSLTELTRAGIETVILVMLVLLVTLGWRESLVAAASIPLSFLVAFIGLLASGNTLNNVSLFSLILAIGILVDSGIVVVEAFHTRLLKYGNKFEAASAAIREYAMPLIAGTFTTIVVFVPLFFLSGIIGKFLSAIPFTIIFVLLASIFVALGFVPLLAIFFVKPSHGELESRQEKYNVIARTWYQGFLHKFLHDKQNQNRFMLLMGVLFVIALALPSTGILKSIFFPSDDLDYLYVQIEKPLGTELSETDLSVREVEEVLYANTHVASFVSQVGAGSSFAGGFTGPSAGSNIGNITVNLPKNHKQKSAALITELRKQFAGITSAAVTVGEPAGGPPSSSPVSLTFSGDDIDALTTTADNAAHILSDIPGVVNIQASTKGSGAEFVVTLDSAKATELGVSPLVVADTLRTALFHTKATSIRTGKDDIDVITKLDLNPQYVDPSETTHVSIDAVRNLSIPGAKGPVLLSTIAAISYAPAQSSINHQAGHRIMTVSADVGPKANAVEVTSQFKKLFTTDKIGKGVTVDYGGATADIAQSFTELFIALIAGAALMLSILILEFNSFRHSFYLLLIIPLSLVGVFAGLTLVGQPLSLTSMLGVIALAGVIINHAIILMDSIARIHRDHPGHSLEQVVVDAASTRLRPILLTTVVTVIGMLPLAFSSAFFGPLAVAIMFGLAFSLLLTLVLIPMLYFRWPGKAIREHYASAKEDSH